MLRDKDYLITHDELIFNVIGYEHSLYRSTANLKYVRGGKWTESYESAVSFLKSHFPHYVHNNLIMVSHCHVKTFYSPRAGFLRILSNSDRNALEHTAISLAQNFANFFQIAVNSFGVTDSLLWSRGRSDSDIDLVVYGYRSAIIVLSRIGSIYDHPEFERLGVKSFTRRATIRDRPIVEECRRKLNKGLYKGARFTLRAVRDWSEIQAPTKYQVVGPVEKCGRITDRSESLFFPATYTLDSGIKVVSYLTQHEAAFEVGERLSVRGILERGPQNRVIVGGLHERDERIEVVPNDDGPNDSDSNPNTHIRRTG